MDLPKVDLKVAFTAVKTVPDVPRVLECAAHLAQRLRIGFTRTRFERTAIEYWHGFNPLPAQYLERMTPDQLEQQGYREIRSGWHRLDKDAFSKSPYYQYRIQMLNTGTYSVPVELEADGICLAVHDHMFTIHLRLISLHLEDQKTIIGPFVGDLFETSDSWMPFHELEERTTVGGPLAHIRLIEFLAALKREALPSLAIRDPSHYLKRGDVFAFLETMSIATDEFGRFAKSLSSNLEIPDINDTQSAIPNLSGPVGSESRLAQLEQFLDSHSFVAPDIHDMLERGR
jgi:hypothetical protein